MEYIITSLLSIILALIIWRLKDWLSFKINPDIKLKRAPKNLLEHITPHVTIDKVKEILGAPYRDENTRMTYKFKNANVVIKKKDDRVSAIILLLKKLGVRNKYPIPPTNHTLGEVKLGELIDTQENVGADISSKHGQVWVERYFGNPGNYWYFTFGIFHGPGALYPYDLPSFSIEEQKITSSYEELKPNFIGISNESGQGWSFNFYAMR